MFTESKNVPLGDAGRFIKAHFITFIVIGSYLWLDFISRFRGENFRAEKITKLHKKNALRIEQTILKLGGLFIKVGQLISIMTNFLPDQLRFGLENLQDSVPARPWEQISNRIKAELGGYPEEVFAKFDREPVASASLGQVHTAETKDGKKVAVKVQHMGIEEMSRIDIQTIQRIIRLVGLFLKVKGLNNYYTEIKAMIFEELDYGLEAENLKEITRNFADDPNVCFPEVFNELSTRRVLTLSYVEGIKIKDKKGLALAGLKPSKVAEDLVRAYCQMIFVDGVYHADPHPGNILVKPDGKLFFLDFGATGRLSVSMREGINQFLEAVIKADETQLLDALGKMGFFNIVGQSFTANRVIEHFHRKFQEEIHLDSFSLSSIKFDSRKGFESIADIRKMEIGIRELSSAFYIPKDWVLMQRTGLLLAGLCTHLAPSMNPSTIIRPYLEEFVLGKDSDMSDMFLGVIKEKFLGFLNLPGLVENALKRTLAGEIEFKVKDVKNGARLLYAAGHQLIYTVFSVFSTASGLYFHHFGRPVYADYCFYAAGGFFALLLISFIRTGRLSRRM